MFTKKEMI